MRLVRRISMVREVVIPETKQITLSLPDNYMGSEIEILMFPIREAYSIGSVQSQTSVKKRRKAGCLKGKIWMASDFDAPLEDFKEYM
jgi:hypothetical protein